MEGDKAQYMRKSVEKYSYCFKDKIGAGYSSTVFKGHDNQLHKTVAIKVIKLSQLKTQIHRQLLRSQVQSLLELRDTASTILNCFDVYTTANNTYIITQFCPEGDLGSLIKREKRLMPPEAFQVISDITNAYQQLVKHNIIHRDIKPANIFVNDGQFKLADFGFSIKSNQKDILRCNIGTPLYMPPQALRNNIYSFKSDIWAIGIISHQLLFGKVPFIARSQKDLLAKIENTVLDLPADYPISTSFRELILRCLTIDIERRLSPDGLVKLVNQMRHQYEEMSINNQLPIQYPKEYSVRSKFQEFLYGSERAHRESSASNSVQKMKKNRLNSYLKRYQPEIASTSPVKESVPPWAQPRYESIDVRDKKRSMSGKLRRGQDSPLREVKHLQTVQQNQELQHPSESIIFSKINYCRFMFKTLRAVEGMDKMMSLMVCEKAIFILFKNILVQQHNISRALQARQNVYNTQDWEEFIHSKSFGKYVYVHSRYKEKYSDYFRNKNYALSNSLLVENDSLLHSIEETSKDYIARFHKLLVKEISSNKHESVPADTQKMASSLELMIMFYQMNSILRESGDHLRFSKNSLLDKITKGTLIEIKQEHLGMIDQKIKALGFSST